MSPQASIRSSGVLLVLGTVNDTRCKFVKGELFRDGRYPEIRKIVDVETADVASTATFAATMFNWVSMVPGCSTDGIVGLLVHPRFGSLNLSPPADPAVYAFGMERLFPALRGIWIAHRSELERMPIPVPLSQTGLKGLFAKKER